MDRQLGILGWSQAELARRQGVSAATVTSWRRRGCPHSVLLWLDEVVDRVQHARMVLARYERPKGRPRGRSARRSEAWQPSAGGVVERVRADYGKSLEHWGEADMDQDSDEWGRG